MSKKKLKKIIAEKERIIAAKNKAIIMLIERPFSTESTIFKMAYKMEKDLETMFWL